jgi:hypothetical protein
MSEEECGLKICIEVRRFLKKRGWIARGRRWIRKQVGNL